MIGLFCKRAPSKRRYSANETYNFKEPTNRSHPIVSLCLYASVSLRLCVSHVTTSTSVTARVCVCMCAYVCVCVRLFYNWNMSEWSVFWGACSHARAYAWIACTQNVSTQFGQSRTQTQYSGSENNYTFIWANRLYPAYRHWCYSTSVMIGLFCKRALSKRRHSAKETYNFKEPTKHSHPIVSMGLLWCTCTRLDCVYTERVHIVTNSHAFFGGLGKKSLSRGACCGAGVLCWIMYNQDVSIQSRDDQKKLWVNNKNMSDLCVC